MTLTEVEVVETLVPAGYCVEAQTEDGGIRRALFIDAEAEERAEQYAEILRSQHALASRRKP